MLSPHLKLPSARLLEMGEPAEISVAQRGGTSVAQKFLKDWGMGYGDIGILVAQIEGQLVFSFYILERCEGQRS